MTTGVLDELAFAKYQKHEPASTINLADGDPLDAGSAIMLQSNAKWLENEAPRHLCKSIGNQYVTYSIIGNARVVYGGYADVGAAALVSTAPDYAEHYWTRNTSAWSGPHYGIADRWDSTSGMLTLRSVVCQLDVYSNATDWLSTDLYYAIVGSPSRTALFRGAYYDFAKVSAAGSGRYQPAPTLLKPSIRVTPAASAQITARAASTYGSSTVIVVPYYVVFGWRFLNTFVGMGVNLSYVNMFSAFETRRTS